MLKDLLVKTKPRETSGSRAANRFELQKSWALCRLIELHRSGQDYLIVFDYHDDILILDSSSDPQKIDFYQIKSKKYGTWTAANLVKREKGESGDLFSPLGKLITNKLTFPDHTNSLSFVSNAGFRVKVKGRAGSIVQDVCLSELTTEEKKEILKSLRDEHSLTADPDCIDCIYLANTPLSIDGHDDQAMGVLGRYLEELYPEQKVHLPAVYRTLSDEIKRKTNLERPTDTFETLCAERSISKDRFDAIMRDVRPQAAFDQFLNEALGYLKEEGMGFDEVRELRSACQTYEVQRMGMGDSVLRKARGIIEKAVQERRAEGSLSNRLTESINEIRERVRDKTKLLVKLRSEHYRTAMILMAIYGA
jgi:hypothetical protein